jgi:hypothetical protein
MSKVYIPSIPYRIQRDPETKKPLRDPETGEVLKDPAVDVTVAAVYGQIDDEPIFSGYGVPPAASQNNINQVRRRLRNFDPDKDSIIAVGDPVAVALCCAIAVRDFGGFSILRWDGKSRQYVKMHFSI